MARSQVSARLVGHVEVLVVVLTLNAPEVGAAVVGAAVGVALLAQLMARE